MTNYELRSPADQKGAPHSDPPTQTPYNDPNDALIILKEGGKVFLKTE